MFDPILMCFFLLKGCSGFRVVITLVVIYCHLVHSDRTSTGVVDVLVRTIDRRSTVKQKLILILYMILYLAGLFHLIASNRENKVNACFSVVIMTFLL